MSARLHTKIIYKHDIAENWAKAENFIPDMGELIIYDADENETQARIKIGNSSDVVSTLAFITSTNNIESITISEINAICV